MTLDFAEKLRELEKEHNELESAGINSRVLLVDSLNTYIRCFCAVPSMNDDGEHVGGVVGYLKSVGLTIRQFNPTRVICVFDGRGGSQRRRKLYEGYKEKRRSMERLNRTYDFKDKDEEQEAMKWQLHLLIDMLEKLPVTVLAVENIEADDTIAYLTQLVDKEGGESIIASTDKDFLQLVSESCKVYNPIKKKMYGPTEVVSEYGIHPDNFLIYRILEGDKSDNIPGVKGVGKKTLLKHFPQLRLSGSMPMSEVIEMCQEIERLHFSISKKIIEADKSGLLELNRQLMDLSDPPMSGASKLEILEEFQNPPYELNKYALTKLFSQFKLLSTIQNYDEWLTFTWSTLNRHVKKEKA
jgi:DNA polymerase-1